MSFRQATQQNRDWYAYSLASGVLLSLSVYVFLLTRLKYKRIKEQKDQFKKIKILTSNFELDVSPEFAEVLRAQ